MAGARTRKQMAAELQQEAAHNGNGKAQETVASLKPASEETTENIFLFWPNIIGYWRIVLAIGALWYMPLHPRTCSLLYSVSCLLDALDGYAARYLNQSTKFGAVLDMVTDRCTTSCLLVSAHQGNWCPAQTNNAQVFLSSAFPRWAIVFQGLISLDFASHYVYVSLRDSDRGVLTRPDTCMQR